MTLWESGTHTVQYSAIWMIMASPNMALDKGLSSRIDQIPCLYPIMIRFIQNQLQTHNLSIVTLVNQKEIQSIDSTFFL